MGILNVAGNVAKPDGVQAGKATKPASDTTSRSTPRKADSDPVPVALELGWTMAALYGPGRDGPNGSQERLPTEHELPQASLIDLDAARANALLHRLATMMPKPAGREDSTPAVKKTPGKPDLEASNLAILTWLAVRDREVELAYQLGRSLRDTANPPLRDVPDKTRDHQIYDAVWYQLSRGRVATLQEWLSVLSPRLPGDSATIVSASIGRWGDLVSTAFDPGTPGRLRGAPRRIGDTRKKVARGHAGPPAPPTPSAGSGRGSYPSEQAIAGELYRSLLPQGDAWLNLLTGTQSSGGLLTPEGYVAAGEAALGRSARIIKRILVHYWFLLLVVAGAVAAALFFAARDLGGAGKLWTQIATVGGALGITAKGIGHRMATLTEDAGKSLFTAEEDDAKAWAVTCIPANLKLTGPGVRALRRSGIRGPVPLGRV